MDEKTFAKLLCQQLDRGLNDLDPLVLARLRTQRQKVLAQMCISTGRTGWSLNGTHLAVGDYAGRWSLMSVLLVFSLVFCGFWWQAKHQESEEEAGLLEARILAAEIPPQDLAQKDFTEWLQEKR
ncbi:DUF3619 family protein [Ferrovum myxofaciens]|uniref:DUF3619 family protein n=2 Tax=root TaxID=1 RepID=A0A859AA06_9PROT|nr:DUF3619 family protein [Ferrovum myxofaciens]NDU89182.1 DUF3619 family protein [Ferrovum sp.]KXW57821.1 hypothetical protein FEMY_16290 [Ferrovum myxofaciens]MBU6995318.1 DUF3619 family protein [Ferrovum myxofaciens]QKE39059.1 MAG: DUF3619 family protein [Ferrovum myxofaciens]QKE41616.1 MAG: DUF3619 family protein [Ferrovum myxofaciens]